MKAIMQIIDAMDEMDLGKLGEDTKEPEKKGLTMISIEGKPKPEMEEEEKEEGEIEIPEEKKSEDIEEKEEDPNSALARLRKKLKG